MLWWVNYDSSKDTPVLLCVTKQQQVKAKVKAKVKVKDIKNKVKLRITEWNDNQKSWLCSDGLRFSDKFTISFDQNRTGKYQPTKIRNNW